MKKIFFLNFSCLFLLISCSTPPVLIKNIKNNDQEIISENFKENKAEQNYNNAYNFYNFSKSFFNDLKEYTKDNVLNKFEMNNLFQNSSVGEKNFLNILKNKEYFIMSDINNAQNEKNYLEFIINNNFSIDSYFLKKVNSLIKDHVLEKHEIDEILNTSTDEEKKFINEISKYDIYNNFLSINSKDEIIEIDLEMYYDENQLIQGKSMLEIISNIGQSDRLSETYTDQNRCGTSLIVNFILIVKGEKGFYDLSKKLGLNFDKLTYKNVHLAQERIMTRIPSYKGLDIRVSIENNIVGGTFFKALELSDIEWKNDFVKKNHSSYKEEIESHLLSQENNAIILTDYVYDKKDRHLDKEYEHASLLTYKYGYYYITDTSGRNGIGSNHTRLSEEDMKEIYSNTSPLIKINI